MGYDRT
jgi:hypothetical protein